MKIWKRLMFALLLAGLLTGCAPAVNQQPASEAPENVPPVTRATMNVPRFQRQDCWFIVPKDVTVDCGYIDVAEDRGKALSPGNTIRLAVAVFRARTETPAQDPVVYHVGGPGGHMLNIVPYIFDNVIAPFLKTRDLILFDPRGTGFSQPALECGAAEDPGDCVRRLFAEGHNLYAYNSSSMAADLQDIRAVLGYDRWNLIGESYGTHVSQIAIRTQPDGLRAVILDAVLPVVLPALPGAKSEFETSLERLFDHCRQDAGCDRLYPDLPGALDRAVRALDKRPVTVQFDMDGKRQSAILNGETLQNYIMAAMYEHEMIPYLPFAISAAADGSSYEFWKATRRWEIITAMLVSSGAKWAVLCSDGRIDPCDRWPVAINREAVASPIPTLLLSGEFDPVTPPDYAREVARRLPNSFVIEFPGFGHWANGTGHPCQASIVQAFLQDPSHPPDARCLTELRQERFATPEEAARAISGGVVTPPAGR